MARKKSKSYQRGSIVARKRRYGTAYILRYRVRNGDTWVEKSETLEDCPNRKTALEELNKRLKSVNKDNSTPKPREITFNELLESHWADYLDTQAIKPSTRYGYGSIIENWIKPHFGEMPLSENNAGTVSVFMRHLRVKKLSAQYRKNIYVLLKLLFDIAAEYDYIDGSPIRPKLHRPKVERRKRQTLTAEQGATILKHVDGRYRAAVATLAMTGIRAGELLGLQWRHVDFGRKRLVIAQAVWRGKVQTSKTESSDREIGLSEALAALLEQHRGFSRFIAPDDFVFCQPDGKPIDPDSLRKLGIYPAMGKAGVPFKKGESGCHAFRHLASSVIHKETRSLKLAQEQLGHSDISTTGDTYTHVDEKDLDEAAKILGQTLGRFLVVQPVVQTLDN